MFRKHKAEPRRVMREVQLEQYKAFEYASVLDIQTSMPDMIAAMQRMIAAMERVEKDSVEKDSNQMDAYDAVVKSVLSLIVTEAETLGLMKLDDETRDHVRKLL